MRYYVIAFNNDGIANRTPEGSWSEMESIYLAYRASYGDSAFVAIVPVKTVYPRDNDICSSCPYLDDENECPLYHDAPIVDCHHYQNFLSEVDE